jgi:hypothetical protein
MRRLIIILFLGPLMGHSQMTKSDSLWLPLRPLIGKWVGTGQAPEGKGNYERSYQFVLNNKFIEVRNKSVYPPSQEKPKGYVHEDHGMISYDKSRKTFVLRQFHGEGFVNEYVLESVSADGKTIVFITESIENIPKGWRARETYHLSDKKFTENFDLAEPGKDFTPYSNASFEKQN